MGSSGERAGAGIASRDEVLRFLAESKIDNYQRIELPHGLVTPGLDRAPSEERALQIDLTGRSLLDLGCKYGYFCHRALLRGATRVVGVDNNPESVRVARRIAELWDREIEFVCGDFLDFEEDERFDVVLFLNMLHHVVDPIVALHKVAALTRELLVVEFATPADRQTRVPRWARWPVAALTRRLPLVYLGNTPGRRIWYPSQQAFANLMTTHLGGFRKLEFEPSPLRRGRLLARCWK